MSESLQKGALTLKPNKLLVTNQEFIDLTKDIFSEVMDIILVQAVEWRQRRRTR